MAEERRDPPIAVRFTAAELDMLSKLQEQTGLSRHALIKAAVMALFLDKCCADGDDLLEDFRLHS